MAKARPFERILVPLDFSEANQLALEAAATIGAQNKSRIALLHVVETVEHIPFEEIQSFYSRLEQEAYEELERLSARFSQQGLEVQSKVVFGKRTEEILNFAADFGTDLMVLSSHVLDPTTQSKTWGTISYKIGLLAPCPILLMR